jgi:hypothetical protein
MQSFLQCHADDVKGVLSGFDRIRFRGTLRWLASLRGLSSFLACRGILLKDFKDRAQTLTGNILRATEALAAAAGLTVAYLPSSHDSKEQHARALASAAGHGEGLVGVFKCVEPCQTFSVGPDRARRRLELRCRPGRCAHRYFYLRHPGLGWLHVRLQTWLPFTAPVCLNGREWLARRLRRQGVGFEQRHNCFVDVADVARAQALLGAQLRADWGGLLGGLLHAVHPGQAELFGEQTLGSYWSAEETEWATDVLFRTPEALARLYPRLARHAVRGPGSGAVLRLLGHRPEVWRFHGSDLHTTLRTRPEGVCVKHRLNHNTVKGYDKQQSVLRVETTINDARDLRVFRARENDPQGPLAWRPLPKGVADLHRRAEVSQKANERYLEALAAVQSPQTLREAAGPGCQRTTWKGRPARGLRPWRADDAALLAAVARGEFVPSGFRNRDLRPLLFGAAPPTARERARQASRVTRLLRLLRAHALVSRVPKSHRYQLSEGGRITITALLAAQEASTQQLAGLAG